jgi:hypothetical protein
MVVDEIYDVLVSRFGVGEVFSHNTTWKEFITYVVIDSCSMDSLATKCGYSHSSGLSRYTTKQFKHIKEDKKLKPWKTYLTSLVEMKKCPSCNEIKPLSNFSINTAICKNCDNNKRATYVENSREKVLSKSKIYYQNNKESRLLSNRWYRLLNSESIAEQKKEYHKKYYQEHKYLYNAKNAKRRATKLQATPKWANLIAIKEIYQTCPPGYHVDHIVPLQGKLVCGLHCEFNLQHLSASENLSKGNRFEVC